MQETIAAIATGSGAGGIGVIRVSGPRAIEIVSQVVGIEVGALNRTIRYVVATATNGERIDDVLVFAMRAPHSFTGEDVVELQGHGGQVNLARLLRAVVEYGARIAAPGEFSRRAFENGKLDLLRAEGLLGVIEASSERAWRISQTLLSGALGRRIDALESKACAVLAEVEGAIDFPEEDLEEQGGSWLRSELSSIAAECDGMVRSFPLGAAVRNGITVALVGAANVGKSSLLNALVGKERALVSATPGTTRDYLEAQVEWDGVRVTLIDTAGWRVAGHDLEEAGIEMGRSRAMEADVVLVINDGDEAIHRGEEFGSRVLLVRSKVDVAGPHVVGLATSARTGEGLAEVKRAVLGHVGLAETAGDNEVLITERQRRLAAEAQGCFARAAALFRELPRELVAYDIREGYKLLTSMRGAVAEDRVVDEIFARFCIGK